MALPLLLAALWWQRMFLRTRRYLQASDLVKSQISVPVTFGGRTHAVLNVESYFLNAFKAPEERNFVESCAKVVASCFEHKMIRDLVNA